MTTEEYAVFINKKQQETNALLEDAKKFTRTLFSPDKYVEYLELMSRFHRYSFVNILLVHLQFPGASYLSGFETWKTVAMETFNDSSYQILQRSYIGKGIKILVPFTVTANAVGNKGRYLINIPVSVYDINQTNNLPLPEVDPLSIDLVNQHLMKALRSNTPYRYILVDKTDKYIQSGLRSYFDKVNRFILIDDSLSETDCIKEYIHTWTKIEIYDFFKQKNIHDTYFGFATSSAEYVIRMVLGLNTTDIAFRYVPQYATVDETEIWTVLHGIQVVSHAIIEKITDDILEMKELAEMDWSEDETILDYDFLGIGVD